MTVGIILRHKLLVAVLLLATFLRLDGLYPNTLNHQDEPLLISTSRTLLSNILFQGNFDPNLPPHPFKYGSSMFYVHAATTGVVLSVNYVADKINGTIKEVSFKQYVTDVGLFKNQQILLTVDRAVTAVFGIAGVFVIYLIGKSMFGHHVGLLSALILAVNPFHVRDSHYATVDVPQLFFILLAFLFSIYLWQRPKLRWYYLAAFTVGFSASIKYFPLAVLPFLLFCFLNRRVVSLKSKNFLLSLAMIPVGFMASSPFLLFHPEQVLGILNLTMKWYQPQYYDQPASWQIIMPDFIHPFHLKFLISDGFLVGPMVTAVIGWVVGWRFFPIQTLALSVVPLSTLAFITFYLQPVYERLSLPLVPFLAVFAALAIVYVWQKMIKLVAQATACALITILIAVTIGPSVVNAYGANQACKQPINDQAALLWMKKNLSPGTKLAYQPGMRVPEIGLELVRSELKGDFSLAEVQKQSANYMAVTSGYTDGYLEWMLDVFIIPQPSASNNYISLVLNEYHQRANLIQNFVKPAMCVDNKIYFFKLPPSQQLNDKKQLASFSFDSGLEGWRLTSFTTKEFTTIEHVNELNQSGHLGYSYHLPAKPMGVTTQVEAVSSPVIAVEADKVYSVSAMVYPKMVGDWLVDGFIRLDFLNQDSQPILTALSSRAQSQQQWQQLNVAAKAPAGARFLTIGFQSWAPAKDGSFLIDDVVLSSQQ